VIGRRRLIFEALASLLTTRGGAAPDATSYFVPDVSELSKITGWPRLSTRWKVFSHPLRLSDGALNPSGFISPLVLGELPANVELGQEVFIICRKSRFTFNGFCQKLADFIYIAGRTSEHPLTGSISPESTMLSANGAASALEIEA